MNSHSKHTRIPLSHFFAALVVVGLFVLLLLPQVLFGAEIKYQPLVGIPQLGNAAPNAQEGTGNMAAYFNKLYLLAIAVGAIIAFVKISIAGVKWSLSHVVTDKSDAMNDIRGALIGMVVLLAPYIVLSTIYGNLVNLNVLDKAPRVDLSSRPNTMNPQTNNCPNGKVYDTALHVCTTPQMTVEKTVYKQEEVTAQIHKQWQDKCGSTLRSQPTPDGGRAYWCEKQPSYSACVYDRTVIPPAPNVTSGSTYQYDNTKCKADCTTKSGTWNETSASGGTCMYFSAS